MLAKQWKLNREPIGSEIESCCAVKRNIQNVDDIPGYFRYHLHHPISFAECELIASKTENFLRRCIIQGMHPEDLQQWTERIVSLCNRWGSGLILKRTTLKLRLEISRQLSEKISEKLWNAQWQLRKPNFHICRSRNVPSHILCPLKKPRRSTHFRLGEQKKPRKSIKWKTWKRSKSGACRVHFSCFSCAIHSWGEQSKIFPSASFSRARANRGWWCTRSSDRHPSWLRCNQWTLFSDFSVLALA